MWRYGSLGIDLFLIFQGHLIDAMISDRANNTMPSLENKSINKLKIKSRLMLLISTVLSKMALISAACWAISFLPRWNINRICIDSRGLFYVAIALGYLHGGCEVWCFEHWKQKIVGGWVHFCQLRVVARRTVQVRAVPCCRIWEHSVLDSRNATWWAKR